MKTALTSGLRHQLDSDPSNWTCQDLECPDWMRVAEALSVVQAQGLLELHEMRAMLLVCNQWKQAFGALKRRAQLPEIIKCLRVQGHLGPKSLHHMRLVSKHWRVVTDATIKQLLVHVGKMPLAAALVFPQLQRLSLEDHRNRPAFTRGLIWVPAKERARAAAAASALMDVAVLAHPSLAHVQTLEATTCREDLFTPVLSTAAAAAAAPAAAPAAAGHLRILPGLRTLRLDRCWVPSNPGWVAQLRQLQELQMQSCSGADHGLPLAQWLSVLTAMTSFQRLGLNDMGSVPLPPDVSKLTGLQQLRFSGSMLEQPLPVEVGALTRLKGLDLSGAKLMRQLPSAVTELTALTSLNLRGCHGLAKGPGPGNDIMYDSQAELLLELMALTRLQKLQLSHAPWRFVPASLSALTALVTLDMSRTQLALFPAVVLQFTRLEELHFSCDVAEVSLPQQITALQRLQALTWQAGWKACELLEAEPLLQLPCLRSLQGCLGTTELRLHLRRRGVQLTDPSREQIEW